MLYRMRSIHWFQNLTAYLLSAAFLRQIPFFFFLLVSLVMYHVQILYRKAILPFQGCAPAVLRCLHKDPQRTERL